MFFKEHVANDPFKVSVLALDGGWFEDDANLPLMCDV